MIARSVPKGHGAALRYVRRYPEGSLFGHPIGYSFVQQGDSEFEQFHNDQLVGERIRIRLDPRRAARQEAGRQRHRHQHRSARRSGSPSTASKRAGFGAVVAIEPSTGRVRVMASNAPYDPNRVPYELEKLNSNEVEAPLLDRATQSRYPPGSTFKVVTAAAALDSGTITPETVIDAPGSIDRRRPAAGKRLQHLLLRPTLDGALTNSVNTWFAQVGARVGEDTLFEYMDTFRLQHQAADRPALRRAPGERLVDLENGGKLLTANDPIDIERVAIGQERLLVTPLQIAEVAAAVANKGTR